MDDRLFFKTVHFCYLILVISHFVLVGNFALIAPIPDFSFLLCFACNEAQRPSEHF